MNSSVGCNQAEQGSMKLAAGGRRGGTSHGRVNHTCALIDTDHANLFASEGEGLCTQFGEGVGRHESSSGFSP